MDGPDEENNMMIGNIVINDAVIRKYATSQDARPQSRPDITEADLQAFRHQPSFSRVSERSKEDEESSTEDVRQKSARSYRQNPKKPVKYSGGYFYRSQTRSQGGGSRSAKSISRSSRLLAAGHSTCAVNTTTDGSAQADSAQQRRKRLPHESNV